jgi:hypothetical protein
MFRGSLIVILLLALLAVPVVSAQENDDLTEEELALVERVIESRAKLETYASYAEAAAESRSQMLTINMDQGSQGFSQAVDLTRDQIVIQGGDQKNIAGTITADVTQTEPLANGQSGEITYTLMGEFRLVEGAMYLSASYVLADPTLPEIPDGWAVYTPDENETLDLLRLDDLLDDDDPLERAERIRTTAQDVTLESTTLDDGTPVEVITIIFNREAFAAQIGAQAEEPDPMLTALLAGLSENSISTMVVTLDMDGNPLRVESRTVMESLGMSGPEIDPQMFMEGMTVDMIIDFSEDKSYSQFDETFEPAVVPEDLAE